MAVALASASRSLAPNSCPFRASTYGASGAARISMGCLCFGWKRYTVFSLVALETKHKPLAVKCTNNFKEGIGEKETIDLDEKALSKQLEDAISNEDYNRAALLRDMLKKFQENNKVGILAANSQFYKAFASGDLRTMRRIWSQGESVHCIHPGSGCISGYELVMDSWEAVLGPDYIPMKIDIQNIEIHVKGNLGFVTCLEVLRTSESRWGRQTATNIFEKQNGEWFICVHHASPC